MQEFLVVAGICIGTEDQKIFGSSRHSPNTTQLEHTYRKRNIRRRNERDRTAHCTRTTNAHYK